METNYEVLIDHLREGGVIIRRNSMNEPGGLYRVHATADAEKASVSSGVDVSPTAIDELYIHLTEMKVHYLASYGKRYADAILAASADPVIAIKITTYVPLARHVLDVYNKVEYALGWNDFIGFADLIMAVWKHKLKMPKEDKQIYDFTKLEDAYNKTAEERPDFISFSGYFGIDIVKHPYFASISSVYNKDTMLLYVDRNFDGLFTGSDCKLIFNPHEFSLRTYMSVSRSLNDLKTTAQGLLNTALWSGESGLVEQVLWNTRRIRVCV